MFRSKNDTQTNAMIIIYAFKLNMTIYLAIHQMKIFDEIGSDEKKKLSEEFGIQMALLKMISAFVRL